MRKHLINVAVLMLLAGSSRPAIAQSAAAVRFDSLRDGGVVVSVAIGGRGPFRVLIDTGSNRSAIGNRLVSVLGLAPVAKSSVVTSTGVSTQPVVRLPEVVFGPASKSGLLTTAIPDAELRAALGIGVDGILGQDFLSGFAFTIDYRRHEFRFGRAAESATGRDVRVTLRKTEGRFLADLPQDTACRCVLRFVPDSGADAMVLFETARGGRVDAEREDHRTELTTLGGSALARAVTIRALQVGSVTLRNQPGTVITRDEVDGPDGDGLLPLHLFASVSFNMAEGYMVMRPR